TSLLTILYPEVEAEASAIHQTAWAQPALFSVEYALAKLWQSWGISPDVLLGHSIGEFVAACLAGVFSLEDALKLVSARGRLMQALPSTGKMAALLTDRDRIAAVVSDIDGVNIATVNGPQNTVISGRSEAVDAAIAAIQAQQFVEVRQLEVSHAFHSPLMEPMLAEFERVANKVIYSAPTLGTISNVTGNYAREEMASAAYWCRHIRQPVLFAPSLETLKQQGYQVFIEIGPTPTLSNLGRACLPDRSIAWLPSLHPKREDWSQLVESMAQLYVRGKSIDWKGFDRDYRRQWVDVPTYPFEQRRCWFDMESDRTPGLDRQSDPSRWFYLPSWRRSPLEQTSAKQHSASQTYLVLVDDAGIGTNLCRRLIELGHTAIAVRPGETCSRVSDREYELSPTIDGDWQQLWASLTEADLHPQHIVHIWSVSSVSAGIGGQPISTGAEAIADFERRQTLGYSSLLALVRSLGSQSDSITIHTITNTAQDVTGTEPLDPAAATLLGPVKVLMQEYPHLRSRSVDVQVDDVQVKTRRPIERLVKQLAVELSSGVDALSVAYRGQHRWVQEFEPASWEAPEQTSLPLKTGGTYAVIGDAIGGLGFPWARYLSLRAGAKLAFIGPYVRPQAEWDRTTNGNGSASNGSTSNGPADSDRVSQHIQQLQELEQSGVELVAIQADLADVTQLKAAMESAESQLGPIAGVAYASSFGSDKSAQPIANTGPQQSEHQFYPKVKGLYCLAEALQGQSLDFVLVQSSLSTVVGGLGFAAYTAAHSFADTFTCALNRTSSYPWLSVNWEAWAEEEDGFLQSTTVGSQLAKLALSTEEIWATTDRILAHPQTTQVVVSTADLTSRIQQSFTPPPAATAVEDNQTASTSKDHSRPNLPSDYVAPRNETEAAIVEVWEEFLPVHPIGVLDNFFDLGGNSLPAIQIISRLRERFQVEVPIRALLVEAPTIAGVAEAIAAASEQQAGELSAISDLLGEIETMAPAQAEAQLQQDVTSTTD
ncbi:MAG: acyltransferase domain-containing protein, partial [Cyanobacteria bacterium P01_G01_bin.4]